MKEGGLLVRKRIVEWRFVGSWPADLLSASGNVAQSDCALDLRLVTLFFPPCKLALLALLALFC